MKAIRLTFLLSCALLVACNSKPNEQPVTASSPDEVPFGKKQANKMDKKGFHANIEKATLENEHYRKVLYTGEHMQLVLMSLKPKEEIGMETHTGSDQFFRFEGGTGKCIINGKEYTVADGDAIIIPAGASHNIINTDPSKSLKLYTLYAPPTHKDGVVKLTKKEADSSEEEFDGKTSE